MSSSLRYNPSTGKIEEEANGQIVRTLDDPITEYVDRVPSPDNTINIGSSSFYYKNAYIKGDLSDGTTSKTITELFYVHPNHYGDVSSISDGITTINPGVVTLAKMADMATSSLLGRVSGGVGSPEVLSVSSVRGLLSINNVDNTSDLNKPISTATQTALNLKANITSPTLVTPNIGVATATSITIGANTLDTNEWAYLDGINGYVYRAGGTDVPLADGGTNASLTASNGGIFYSTASAGAILSGTATAGQLLQSGASAAPTWSTATYPATATATGTILRANGTNWVATTATYPTTTTSQQVLYSTGDNVIGASANMTFDGNRLTLSTTGSIGGLIVGGDAAWYRVSANTVGGAVKLNIFPSATNSDLIVYSFTGTQTVTSSGTYNFFLNDAALYYSVGAGKTNSGNCSGTHVLNLRSNGAGLNDSGTVSSIYGNNISIGHYNADKYANPHTTYIYATAISSYIRRGVIDNYYGFLISTPGTIATPSAWVKNTAYAQDTIVAPTVANGYYYIAQNAGTSAASEPSPWSTTENGTTTDNDITWFTLIIPAITNEYGLYSNSATAFNYFAGNVGIGSSAKTSQLYVAGNKSLATWGTSGIRFNAATAIYTDTSGSGTVASIATDSFAPATLVASHAVTYTDATTFYIGGVPIASTNVTITSPWALWVSGATRFDSTMSLVNSTVTVTAGTVIGTIQAQTFDTQTTTNHTAASIEFRARNTITTDINPGQIFFRSTSSTVAATLTDRYLIDDKGLINCGSTPISITTPNLSFNTKLLYFSGNSSFLQWTNGNITELNSVANFSFSFFINSSDYSVGRSLVYSLVDGSNVVQVQTGSSGNFRITINNGSSGNYGEIASFPTNYPVNTWVHIVITYDGTQATNAGKLKLYLNNVLQTLTFTGTIPTTTPNLVSTSFNLSNSTTGAFNGYYRRFAIYSSTLSAANVTTLYNGTNISTNQVHYWLLNEGYGTSITDSGSNPKVPSFLQANPPTWVDSNQIAINTDFGTALLNFGASTVSYQGIGWANEIFLYRGAANVLNLTGSLSVSGDANVLGTTTITEAKNIVLGTTTGTKIGTATNQKLSVYNKTPVVQQTALTTQLTTITASAPGTPDYAIADLTQTLPYGFVSADEGQSVLKVVANLQTRLAELESRLSTYGWLP